MKHICVNGQRCFCFRYWLVDFKPTPGPILKYYSLDHKGQHLVKFQSIYPIFIDENIYKNSCTKLLGSECVNSYLRQRLSFGPASCGWLQLLCFSRDPYPTIRLPWHRTIKAISCKHRKDTMGLYTKQLKWNDENRYTFYDGKSRQWRLFEQHFRYSGTLLRLTCRYIFTKLKSGNSRICILGSILKLTILKLMLIP